ncbi:xylose isomerase domain-containing protein [Psychromonas sp. CNPT3]|uniref:sugar phosphate isomerase/epimerase family protein n=1 Tax=Psychromonas sp. CNPT3 TaxID=314282 RepID=UPI0002C04FFF|nr:sugar phosphate isomerase/epimerase [Psychromonas sp. CNPT3]AGH82498.1 xylose isomerase domain-containing protein [Psychromonas sp. CNPT3]
MISISNIAWDVSLDKDVAEILVNSGVSYIDIAPPKYFNNIHKIKDDEIIKVKKYWLNQGITPLGMQSLLFGTNGLNVFGTLAVQNKLLAHLADICHIGNILGARKLVFGSPKNRDRSHLSDKQTIETSCCFFNRLGDIARASDVVICLEPNPECYQSNFMTNSIETADMVKAINHTNIRMQLDIGAMDINNESADDIIKHVAPFVHHIHISEPQLAPLNINNSFHRKASAAIQQYLPNMPMTIEMLTTSPSMTLKEIEQSINLIKTIYLDD